MPTLQTSPQIFIECCEDVLSVPTESLKVHDDYYSLHKPLSPRSTCVVIFGELSVGKSALCQKFFANAVLNAKSLSEDKMALLEVKAREVSETSGKHYIYERPVKVAGESFNLKILDINTEKHLSDCDTDDRVHRLKNYVEMGEALIVAYAVNDYESFETAKYMLSNVVGNTSKPVVLVANKSDLVRQRKVSKARGIKLAERYNLKFIETSASLNVNVDNLFEGIVNQIRLNKACKKVTNPDIDDLWLNNAKALKEAEGKGTESPKPTKANSRRLRKYGRSNSSVSDWCRNKIKGIKKCEDLSVL